MNWFNENKWLGTFLVVFALALIAATYFVLNGRSASNDSLAHFQDAIAKKNQLERLDPFPSEANFRKMKQHLENYGATLNKLKEELKTRVPAPAPIAPNEFQARLRQSMTAIAERARVNRVKLPDNFALGFDEYTAGLPGTGAAPLLGQELAQIEALLNLIIDAHVDGITGLVRRRLPEEGGATTTPSPTPGPRGVGPVTGPPEVERGVIDLSFGSSPSAARKVLNQVVSAPQQFYIVRTLHVRNEKDRGPAREQPIPSGATSATAQPQPTPVRPTQPGALNFIVGNEDLELSARIELLRFNLQ
jgi:hypothetical protein